MGQIGKAGGVGGLRHRGAALQQLGRMLQPQPAQIFLRRYTVRLPEQTEQVAAGDSRIRRGLLHGDGVGVVLLEKGLCDLCGGERLHVFVGKCKEREKAVQLALTGKGVAFGAVVLHQLPYAFFHGGRIGILQDGAAAQCFQNSTGLAAGKTDPSIAPWIVCICDVKGGGAGADQERLAAFHTVPDAACFKIAAAAQHAVDQVMIADGGPVAVRRGAVFDAAMVQIQRRACAGLVGGAVTFHSILPDVFCRKSIAHKKRKCNITTNLHNILP